jgi:hypothetical protein
MDPGRGEANKEVKSTLMPCCISLSLFVFPIDAILIIIGRLDV